MPGPLDASGPCLGAVLFEGLGPPRPESFAALARRGVEVRPTDAGEDACWRLGLRHAEWGEAELYAPQQWPRRLAVIVQHAGFLTREERAIASAARSAVFVRLLPAPGRRLLRTKKLLLRWLGAVLGDEGLVAFDLDAPLPWSRAALDEELAHDADVDVSALYVLHSVVEREGAPVRWLHSHGLGEVGGFDFDLLDPHPELLARSQDAIRALAFAIVEGRVAPDTPSFDLVVPSGKVAFVPAAEFDRAATPEDRGLRTLDDPEHTLNRAVVCEPQGGVDRALARPPRPARCLSRAFEEGALFNFSDTATELMADRARRTLGVLRGLVSELAGLRLPALVKLGYETDDRAGREHLWFEVHDVRDDRVDATLVNEPYEVGRLHQGDRGEHGIERITDWLIPTPFGLITPRSQVAARRVRAHVADMLKLDDPPAR